MKFRRPVWLATIIVCAALGAIADRSLGEDNLADGWLYDATIAVSGRLTDATPQVDPVAVVLTSIVSSGSPATCSTALAFSTRGHGRHRAKRRWSSTWTCTARTGTRTPGKPS